MLLNFNNVKEYVCTSILFYVCPRSAVRASVAMTTLQGRSSALEHFPPDLRQIVFQPHQHITEWVSISALSAPSWPLSLPLTPDTCTNI